jgi:hypothetical protein
MPNYQNGKIYSIRCRNDDTLIYIGSTTQKLTERLAQHRRQSNKHSKRLYECVNGNWTDWYIELYEECPCNNKQELDKKEGEIIRQIGNLNKNIAGRTRKEYRDENKEIIKEYTKLYNERPEVIYRIENNKELKRVYDKEYREKNKELKRIKDKEYAVKNKERIKEYQKEYRLKMNENKMLPINK